MADYRDPNNIDPNGNFSITQLVKFIREKMFGIDVRESIAKALEKVYEDASKDGNANMEVSEARGFFGLLKDRLNDSDRELSKKADKTYVDTVLSSIASGGPKELFYSLNALKVKYPQGAEGTYLVFDASHTDGAHSYMWKDSAWNDLGVYQGLGIPNKSVTADKLAEDAVTPEVSTFAERGTNLFDGKFISGYGLLGDLATGMSYSERENGVVAILRIVPGLTYTISHSANTNLFGAALFSEEPKVNDTAIRVLNGNSTIRQLLTFTSGENETYLVAYLSSEDEIPDWLQIELGTKATSFVGYQQVHINLSEESIPTVTPEMTSFAKRGKNLFTGDYTYGLGLTGNVTNGMALADRPNAVSYIFEGGQNNTFTISRSKDTDFYGIVTTADYPHVGVPVRRALNGNTSEYDSFTVTLEGDERYIFVYLSSQTQSKEPQRFQIEEGAVATPYSPPNAIKLILENDHHINDFSPKMNVVKNGNEVKIYIPSKSNPNRFMCFTYLRDVNVSINLDMWRQKMVGVYSRINGTYVLEFNLSASDTEWEGAVEEVGADDFIGGWHGDEFIEDLSFVVDGNEINMGSDFNLECSFVKAVTKSAVNRCNTSTKAFTRYKANTWSIDQPYSIENKWIASIPFSANEIKITMCSVDRKNNGKNILKWGRYDHNYEKTDISIPFDNIGVDIPRTDVFYQEIWSDEENFYVVVSSEYDRNEFPDAKQYIQSFDDRAKIYYDLGPKNLEQGDVLKVKSIFEFNF